MQQENKSTYHTQGTLNEINNITSEIMKAGSQWDDIFKELKEKDYQLRILYSAKQSFKNEGKIQTFPDKHKQSLLLADLPYKKY